MSLPCYSRSAESGARRRVRPFFGLGESLNFWKPLGDRLPLHINALAGFVYMNQEDALPGASGKLEIQHARVWKPMFGIEIPVAAVIGKITQVGGGGGGAKPAGGK